MGQIRRTGAIYTLDYVAERPLNRTLDRLAATAALSTLRPSPCPTMPNGATKGRFGKAAPQPWQVRRRPGLGRARQLWPLVQIDAAEARRMDMRSDQEGSGRTRYGTEEVRLPRDAGLARKNAPENGAIEQTDRQCRAQRDQ